MSVAFQSEWDEEEAAGLAFCASEMQQLAEDLAGLSYMCSLLPKRMRDGRTEELLWWIDILAVRVRGRGDLLLADLKPFGTVRVS